jgi:hypothetical protein
LKTRASQKPVKSQHSFELFLGTSLKTRARMRQNVCQSLELELKKIILQATLIFFLVSLS